MSGSSGQIGASTRPVRDRHQLGRLSNLPARYPRQRWTGIDLVRGLVIGLIWFSASGCAAAVGAALAAGEIKRGLAGVQDLVGGARSLRSSELVLPPDVTAPVAGTYHGYQAVGGDSVQFYVRTSDRPLTPIVDRRGNVTGYVLVAIAATTLDTLESRVQAWSRGTSDSPAGRALFFVEGTGSPDPNARTLYPAAYLGRLPVGESRVADRHYAELLEAEVDMEAPGFGELTGQGIPQELFDSVAEGIFTLRPGGAAVYHQEYEIQEGRTLTLHFERISATTLPQAGAFSHR